MQRRNFISQGCKFCLALGGGSALLSLLDACTPLPIYKTQAANKKITVPLTAFSTNNFLIVRPANLSYDIAVVKSSETEFKSMVMLCTHAENPLQFNGNEFRCSLHGSMFDRLGKVEKGPAERPLITLTTKIDSEILVITL